MLAATKLADWKLQYTHRCTARYPGNSVSPCSNYEFIPNYYSSNGWKADLTRKVEMAMKGKPET